VWTGCGQRAVYTTRKHGGLADWAITELEALPVLDSLSFSFQRLNLSFSGTCPTHTVLGQTKSSHEQTSQTWRC